MNLKALLAALALTIGSGASPATAITAPHVEPKAAAYWWYCMTGSNGRFVITNVFQSSTPVSDLIWNWKQWLTTATDSYGVTLGYDNGSPNCVSYTQQWEAESQRTNTFVHYRDNVGWRIETTGWRG